MRHEKSCGALVIRRDPNDGKLYILMIRHRAGGHRSFPKGHMEKGETEVATAMREVMEETAVRIQLTENNGFRRTVHYCPSPGVKKEVVYFLTKTEQCEIAPRPGEIAEVEWVPLYEAEEALSHENDRRILRAALRTIRTNGLRTAYPLADEACKKGGANRENDRLESAANSGAAIKKAILRKEKRKIRIASPPRADAQERKNDEIQNSSGHHE